MVFHLFLYFFCHGGCVLACVVATPCLSVMYVLSIPRYLYLERHTDQTNLSRETCDGTSTCKLDPLFAGEAKQAVLTIHSDVI